MIIGLYIRHIKAYQGIHYIPIGYKHKFISYLGGNGIGKSSILEALDSFFNNKPYLINNTSLVSSNKTNEGFMTPIFLIKKERVTKLKSDFKKISNYFWDIDPKAISAKSRGLAKDFFEIREKLKEEGYNKEDYYFFLLGDNIHIKKSPHFGIFQSILTKEVSSDEILIEEKTNIETKNEEILNEEILLSAKNILSELKKLFSYVYLPVELEAKSFTKIGSEEMQKIFNKELKSEIENALIDINLDKSDGINSKLETFIKSIETTLCGEYTYTTKTRTKKNLTKTDLVEKIIEVYFEQRILHKTSKKGDKKIDYLSAGEKRQALISLVYAFLKEKGTRDKSIIIGIDEPESSLHSSNCYEQFEKLKEVSFENQILVTTHWYGHLPMLSKGYSYFLENKNEGDISFVKMDLYNYRKDLESNIKLKSINDLVQSIFYSILQSTPYQWIICEGVSEKIYFEYFFKDEIENQKLKILPMNGYKNVIKLFKYLYLPINSETSNEAGKIYCLIDTDEERKLDICLDTRHMKLRRLSTNKDSLKTELVKLEHSSTMVTDIEQSLNPIIFKEVLEALNVEDIYKVNNIVKENGNTSFIKNFENLKLENFFKENDGENKIKFAKKYIEILSSKEKKDDYKISWIEEIKRFF